jgi:AbrB family looped-hinge helix DNA binding protein
MKIGERGQVTIPKDIREQFGLGPETEVEFRVVGGSIVLKKAPKKLNLAKWRGRCGDAFAKLGYSSVDKFIERSMITAVDTNILLDISRS